MPCDNKQVFDAYKTRASITVNRLTVLVAISSPQLLLRRLYAAPGHSCSTHCVVGVITSRRIFGGNLETWNFHIFSGHLKVKKNKRNSCQPLLIVTSSTKTTVASSLGLISALRDSPKILKNRNIQISRFPPIACMLVTFNPLNPVGL